MGMRKIFRSYYSPLSHGDGGSTPPEHKTYLKDQARQNGGPPPLGSGLGKLPECLSSSRLTKLIEQMKNIGCPIKFDFQITNKWFFV